MLNILIKWKSFNFIFLLDGVSFILAFLFNARYVHLGFDCIYWLFFPLQINYKCISYTCGEYRFENKHWTALNELQTYKLLIWLKGQDGRI